MTRKSSINRRDFLKVAAIAGGGLLISLYVPGCVKTTTPSPTASPTSLEGPDELQPNLWVKIDRGGGVTITVHRSEMGQGVRTALAMILAEELGADWQSVRVEQAVADSAYGDQNTGGSTSISSSYLTLRRAGGVARDLFIAAATQTWNCAPEDCYTQNGLVINKTTNEQLPFADLIPLAGTLPVPNARDVRLKPSDEFRLIGTRVGRIDNPDIVTGKAVYGLDKRVPDMLYAVVARPPVIGGSVAGFDDANARAIPGVRAVAQIRTGVAVVADSTWSALRGRQALEITWDEGPNPTLSSEAIEADLMQQAIRPAQEGELIAYYTMPYLSHVPMEPMNCVAEARADRCEVWVPTQSPQTAKQKIQGQTGLSSESVAVNVTLLGGGFGRRLEAGITGYPPVDYVKEAVEISAAVGAPVQLIWTRDDDIHYDIFHPLSVTRVSARLDDIRTLRQQRYDARAVATGYWRAVENVPDAFAHESFLDEYALATNQDPVELRGQILDDRARAVLDLAAGKAAWGTPMPAGYGRGIAMHATWGVSPCAQVVEASVGSDGNVRVHRVVCAVDCGTVINPDMVEAQMESGIIFGLSTALKSAITIANGRVQQSNFIDYPILRMDEAPTIEVYLVPSTNVPSGIGEMSNPVTAPALTNALFAATGVRIRRLPVRPEDLRV